MECGAEKYRERIRKARPAKPLEQEKFLIKSNMKKLFVIVTIWVTAVLMLTGCNKNDDDIEPIIEPHDGKIIASVNAEIEFGEYHSVVTVKAISHYFFEFNELYDRVIETVEFVNGGFTINLPETVSDEYLQRFSDEHPNSKVSDPDAKVTEVVFFACNNEGIFVDILKYGNYKINRQLGSRFWYSDRDFTFKHEYRSSSCSLKRGWNIEYWRKVNKKEIDGMTWYFYSTVPKIE